VESQTSATLLAKLRQVPAGEAAWALFAERHGRKIYARCRPWNRPGAGAEDVTQTARPKVVVMWPTFVCDADQRFRAGSRPSPATPRPTSGRAATGRARRQRN
jgi:hypothetical protein